MSNKHENNIDDWDIIAPKKNKLSLIEKKLEKIEKTNNIIIEMLKENRDLYLKALDDVTKKEDENLEEIREIKPIIINQNKPGLINCLENNNNNHYIDRLTNRFWRNDYLTTPNLSFSNLKK